MRVVVDTNAFASAALKSASWPASVIRWIEHHGGLLKTGATQARVLDVLQRPYFAPKVRPSYLEGERRIFAAAELVKISESVVACRDPTDDKFLELAVNGRADMIVTGDLDLLALNPFRGILIIDAAAFVRSAIGSSWTIGLARISHTGADCVVFWGDDPARRGLPPRLVALAKAAMATGRPPNDDPKGGANRATGCARRLGR